MTNSQPPIQTEPGEGFAYFAWHSLKWPRSICCSVGAVRACHIDWAYIQEHMR